MFRNFTAALVAPILIATGYRFSKDFRWGTSRGHRLVYALVNTVRANHIAGLQ
jgi:hypothetical protein